MSIQWGWQQQYDDWGWHDMMVDNNGIMVDKNNKTTDNKNK